MSQHEGENSQAPIAMNARVAHYPQNTAGRDFAVGDIHGSFSALQQALDAIGFSPATDRLFSVGDLVDRGPESEQVLNWLDKPWFHAICGNHDFIAWRSALGSPYREVDHLQHGGAWLYALSSNEQQRIGQRLAALPIAIEVATSLGPVGLVHADCPYDDWNEMCRGDFTAAELDCCLWSSDRFRMNYQAKIRNVRAVVHGHLTLPSMQIFGNVYFIDTGGWRPGRGHFTLLDLHTLGAVGGPGGDIKRYRLK